MLHSAVNSCNSRHIFPEGDIQFRHSEKNGDTGMKIQSIDLFHFSLRRIEDMADGSQDSIFVRVRSDKGWEGYSESDSSPLISLGRI